MEITDKDAKQRPVTSEEIKALINKDDEWVIGCLIAIYNQQTADEQDSHLTHHLNFAGFNAIDANVMTDISKFYLSRGFLTTKQINFVRRTILKYSKQLLQLPVVPLPIKNKDKSTSQNLPPFKKATIKKNEVEILFSFPKGDDRFMTTLNRVKSLSGRRFHADNKSWSTSLSIENVMKLVEWDFELSEDLKEWYVRQTSSSATDRAAKNMLNIEGLKMQLYPFQKAGVSFVQDRGGRAIIADEMGLGKTAQVIAWLHANPNIRPAVIVVPASIKYNWMREIQKWIGNGPSISVLSGRNGYKDLKDSEIVIVNYDILGLKYKKCPDCDGNKQSCKTCKEKGGFFVIREDLMKLSPKAIILDECHYIKNDKAQRTKAVRILASGVPHVIALSGTPIVNRPVEFFNTIRLVQPALFKSRWAYLKRYCNPVFNGYGWDFRGSSNTKELHDILVKTVMVRRLKKDVLKDLPAKTISVVPVEIENKKEYRRAESDLISWIAEQEGLEKANKASRAKVLVSFEKLKQLAVKGKITQAINWIEDFLESGEKLIVFATHREVINQLMDHFKSKTGIVKLDGSTSSQDRQKAVDKFQTDANTRLFVGNIRAAGVGITLTAASNVCFLELGWTPGEHSQAEDRVHRIGQEAVNAVTAWYLIAHNTIEEDIASIIDSKRKVLASVLDGQDVAEESIVSQLVKAMADKVNGRIDNEEETDR